MKVIIRTYLITLLILLAPLWLLPQGLIAAEPAESSETAPAENSDMRPAVEEEESTETASTGSGVNRDAVVMFGQNYELKAGDTAQVVVVIGGSATIHGKVRDVVVAIGGNIEVDGEVGHEVVAVMGSIDAKPGAVINGDVVSVGGRLNVEEGATVKGQAQEVAVAGLRMQRPESIQKWLEHCVMMLRPLAPQVGWVWMVVLVHFLLFLLIAAVFRQPVAVCVDELERRPATTFLIGLLTMLFLPLLLLILVAIVVGIVVIPFLLAGLFVLSLVGHVGVLEWIGFKIGHLFKREPLEKPILALIIGSVFLALLYMIPVIGLLAMLLMSVWSLGCAMTATFRGFRRELPERPAPAFTPTPAPVMAYTPAPAGVGQVSNPSYEAPSPMPSVAPSTPPPEPAATPGPAPAPQAFPPSGVGDPPVLPEVLAFPKASFWERMAAGFLDVVLIVVLGSFVGSGTLGLIIALAYFSGMWAWRGTTIGGIVLGLKVVRMDGQAVTFPVALVRGLAAGFSVLVLFLGFFWIAWDHDKQGWHDKIAGTVVLRLPRGMPLLCF